MEGNSKKVVLLAFNVGSKGELVNGPGISLGNLLKFSKTFNPNISFVVFSKFLAIDKVDGVRYFSISNKKMLEKEISKADVVHCWSGLTTTFFDAIKLSNNLLKPVIIGPNLLDSVEVYREIELLKQISFNLLLTANPRLKYILSKLHKIELGKVDSFMVGPDLDIWRVPRKVDEYILWKGNGRQFVKDIKFAKRVRAKLPEYKFLFLGEKKEFGYMEHITLASNARLYINTSLSETKGMAQLEQMAAGVPSVVHPKVYCHGENYVTGIIVNKTVDEYVDAIREILDDNALRRDLRLGARKYVEENFSGYSIAKKYEAMVSDVS